MEADLSDLFEISWKALAQVNLNAKLGLSVGAPLDFLPTVQTEFHLYWGMGSEEAEEEESEDPKSQMAKLAEGLGFELPEGEEEPEYFDMFTETPTIWLSDVRLDLGTFFTEFMMPVADRVFEVIGPLIPVIKALTTPIPGLSQLMGKDYTAVDLAVDMAKLFGGETKVEFIVAVVKMVRTLIDMYEDMKENGGNFAIPIAEILVLNAAEEDDEEGGGDGDEKPEVEEKGDKDEALSEEQKDLPEEGSAKDTTDNLEDNADSPGSALAFPFLEDIFGTTIDLLLGNPVDLVTFTPPDLVVEVKFRFGAKIFYIFDVGIYGTLKFGARLTFGFDTYGVMKFLDTKEVLDIFDGFFVSDNVVNGVDLPEIFLETKLGVYVGLDLGIVKFGIVGGIKLTGGINLCDPDKDGKIRPSEFIMMIKEDPAALVSVEVTLGAFILFYIEVLFLKFEFTIVEVVLFEWEYNPCDRQPILAVMDGTDLVFNTGDGVGEIDGNARIGQTAEDRRYRNTDDGNEAYTLTGSGGDIKIDAVLPNGQSYNQSFSGVSRVRGYAGAGNDTFDASAISTPVYFVGGTGEDVLIGGGGDDILISGTGTTLLKGGNGDDLLVARGGNTTMQGQNGDDTYRFLQGWGQANLPTDGNGRNVLDFTAQTQGVTIDDAEREAFQGGNKVEWQGGTTIDQIWGGRGDDRLDFSGNEANLLVTVTGMSSDALNVSGYSNTLMGRDAGWKTSNQTNAGWVTSSATGMAQNGLASGAEQQRVGDEVGYGFKFVGIENIIGGQGSDVFRIRDGASVTGSLHGDTAMGLHHDSATGNENANVRNTIDFSEYTDGVRVDQENFSAFGDAGASRIVVRGMHNMFGGQASDYLAGDGRNNLIVGNDGADTLEGRSAHDLLVADNFLTWMNLTTRPSNGTVVSSYIALEDVGQRAQFGGDGRRWVWLAQSLENRSLTSAGQTLRGGSGNDIQMGALGSDLFNDGGTGAGNDTIMADLGMMKVDFNYRTPQYMESFGRRGGGNDTINLGTGSNIVIGGAGDDLVSGGDLVDSFNIVLGDNGAIKFQSEMTSVGGGRNNWTLKTNLDNPQAAGFSNHMIEYIRAEQDEAPEDGRESEAQSGQAGKDVINLSSGSGVVIGGWGADTITFGAKASVESNTRYVAGDHAELIGDENGGIVAFRTIDTVRSNGGDDFIQVGDQNDSMGRNLGRNYVMAGMGADTVLISAGLDDAGVLRFGAATSEDVVVGDNGEMLRTESVVADELIPNLMLRLQTIQNDKGDDDQIALGHGTKVVLGGVGGDTIEALNGDHLVLGDNGRLDYDSVADNGVLRTVTNTDIVIGGDDNITLGEGYTLVAGGKGNDTIEVAATRAGDATGLAVRDEEGRLRYVAGVMGIATVREASGDAAAAIALDNSGRTGRFISGDNTLVSFDDQGGLIAMLTTDPIAATGGSDSIRIGMANTAAFDLGLQAVVGGMGNDRIEISQEGVSSDVILGDNGDYRRGTRTYGLTHVVSTRTEAGGADSIRTGAGDKIILGGFGSDVISAATLDKVNLSDGEGVTTSTQIANRSIVMGDSGQVLFDLSGAGALSEITSIALGTGGNDQVTLGDGDVTFVGGFGNDNLVVTPSNFDVSAMRVALGDNATLRFAGIADKSAQAENLISVQTLDQTIATGGADVMTVGRAGATMGQAILMGGMGADKLTVLGSTVDSVMIGDNGLVNVVQVASARSITGQQSMSWINHQTANSVSMLTSVESLLPEQGTGDSLATVNGAAVMIGGAGSDQISAGRGQGVVFGDGARISYADGALREAISFGLASGLGDQIELGAGSGADGHKVVVGGAGADTVTVSSTQGTSALPSLRTERVIAGDNASLGFDDQGRLVNMDTPDADIATSGDDALTVLISGVNVDLNADAVFIAGGLGNDRVVVNASGKTTTVASGDNLQVSRNSGDYRLQSAIVSQPSKGGNDSIRLGSGQIYAFGGVGNDQIDVSSKAGDQVVALGDAGYALFEVGATAEWLNQIGTAMETMGGNDMLSIGAGRVMALGGAGRDSIALRAADNAQRVVLGDTGQIDFAGGEVRLVQSTQDGADPLLNGDTLTLPSDGRNMVIGGAGPDNLSAIVNGASRYMPGSGMLESTQSGALKVVSVTVLGNPGEFGMRIDADGVGEFPAIAEDYELVRRDPAAGQTDAGTQTLALTLFGEGEVTVGQKLMADGRIAYPSLRSGLATFDPVLLVGTYGTLELRKDGSWAYALAPGNDVGYNAESTELQRETFYVQTTDGSVTTVVVDVKGAAKRLVDWTTLDAVEATGLANDIPGVVSVGHVSLVTSASFNGQAITGLPVGKHVGDYGVLAIDRNGVYTYTIDEAKADELPDGVVVVDRFEQATFTYTDADGERQMTSVSVRVVGGNDRPELMMGSGSNTYTVAAATPQSVSGSVEYQDVDIGDDLNLSWVVAAVLDQRGDALPLSEAQRQLLVSAFSAQRVNDAGVKLVGDINWTFAPTAATLAMIPAEQTVSIRFELVLQDKLDAEHRLAVNVQAQGSNETSSFAGDLNTVMRASDGRVTGTATVVDADLDEDQFVAQTVQGQFGVLTVQADGGWLYVLNDGAVVPPAATISDRFELATRDDAGQGVRPVVTVFIKGPDLVISASGNAPDALTSPVPVVTAPNAGTPSDPAQTPDSTPLQVVPLGGAPVDLPLGNMNPYTPPAGPGVTLPGAGESSRRTDSPNDPAAQSTEPQQQSAPQEAQPQAATTMQPEQQAIAEETLQEKPEQVSLIDQLTDMADSSSAALSVMGMAAAVAMGKAQRIQWQAQKTAQPSRQRIQW
jgi:VCBS repeat-containing protein